MGGDNAVRIVSLWAGNLLLIVYSLPVGKCCVVCHHRVHERVPDGY